MSRAAATVNDRRNGRQNTGAREVLRLAAIDLGSNSFHMVVAQADADGSVTTLWRVKEMVGVGRASFPAHRLTSAAMDRGIVALRRIVQAAQRRQCEKIVAVATSAIREAENGGDFIERARRELGINVRVVTAREEARLIYLGVRQAVDLSRGPHCIIDIGGGSVEFIVGNDQRPLLIESRKLGAARMTAQFIKSDPIEGRQLKRLLAHYDEQIGGVCEAIAQYAPVRFIGTSGTLESLAAMCGSSWEPDDRGFCGVVERGRFNRLLNELLESGSAQRAQMRGLDSQRQDQIVAGAVLVGELIRRLSIPQIHVTHSALREGILVEYLQRHLPELAIRRDVPDPRRRSVLDLARRCDWHQPHAEQVARLILRLFDQLKSLHGMTPQHRELIEYAALLHDIGWHIARRRHHKHSMYLILNGDLRGFEPEEVRIIACIARYHRKSLPKARHPEFAALSAESRRVVRKATALLRIADGLDRSHGQVITDLRCRLNGRSVAVSVEARGDAELELWGARRRMDYFVEQFDRSITFEQR